MTPPFAAPRILAAVLCLPLLGPLFGVAASAQESAVTGARLAGGADASAVTIRQTGAGDYFMSGNVTIVSGETRFQADTLSLTRNRYIEAEGNVLVIWQGNRIAGSRMTYDLEDERGVIEDAVGQVESDFLFWARRAEKIGVDTIRLESARVTTCTQPVPYWSLAISSATIRVEGYAKMWNVRLRTGKMPLVYLPYVVWPVKQDRAVGLLMPEFQSTETRGRAVSQELFIPLGRSADMTLLGRYYTDAGFGGGGEFRFVPNRRGAARLSGFYIDDKVVDQGRYRASYDQTQEFLNGFRMVADIDLVSDFNYYSDFERQLDLVSSPTILARVEFSRNGPWTSLNVRELRREQLFSDESTLLQQTLPEIEWRGRSRRIGKSPLYFSYESSLASIQQREKNLVGDGIPLDADYLRGDIFPTISAPFSPWPWLDLTPSVSYRLTHYTQRLEDVTLGSGALEQVAVDEDLTRRFYSAGLELTGPKFYRVFERPGSRFSTRYKHSIEPRLTYGFATEIEEVDELILYDEVDRFSGAGNQLTYSIVQRLFAQRPRTRPAPVADSAETILLPDGSSDDPAGPAINKEAAAAPAPDAERESVEIATLSIRQSRSFDTDLSFADLDGDGVNEENNRFSNISVNGRYNPTRFTSVDLRSTYHIGYDKFSDVSFSGTMRGGWSALGFSLVHRNGLGVTQSVDDMGAPVLLPAENDTQLQLRTGLHLFRRKLELYFEGSYDADPPLDQSHLPNSRWQVKYSTQCCSFMVERLNRDFPGLTDRDDFYFRVDLKGIGKILKVSY